MWAAKDKPLCSTAGVGRASGIVSAQYSIGVGCSMVHAHVHSVAVGGYTGMQYIGGGGGEPCGHVLLQG